jgi:hypothetical protein
VEGTTTCVSSGSTGSCAQTNQPGGGGGELRAGGHGRGGGRGSWGGGEFPRFWPQKNGPHAPCMWLPLGGRACFGCLWFQLVVGVPPLEARRACGQFQPELYFPFAGPRKGYEGRTARAVAAPRPPRLGWRLAFFFRFMNNGVGKKRN